MAVKTDPKTGRVTFPKAGEATEPEGGTYVFIDEALMNKLAKWAKADGFVPTAETPKGVQMQTSRAIKSYVFLGLDMVEQVRGGK